MYKLILVVCVLVSAATANLVGWRDCGSQLNTVEAIRVTNCVEAPCTFVRGNTYEAQVDATWRANSNTLPFNLVVVVLGLPITILQGDACDYKVRGQCPAVINDPFTFRSYYPVPTTLPAVSAIARAVIVNDFGDVAICIEVDVTLV